MPARVPTAAGIRPASRGGWGDDDSNDVTSLVTSASFASYYLRLFEPGLAGETAILAPKDRTDRSIKLETLGWRLNTHTGRISLPTANIVVLSTH